MPRMASPLVKVPRDAMLGSSIKSYTVEPFFPTIRTTSLITALAVLVRPVTQLCFNCSGSPELDFILRLFSTYQLPALVLNIWSRG